MQIIGFLFKRKVFFITLVISIIALHSNVFAYNTYDSHKLTGGVGNYGKNTQYYWIDETAKEFTSEINTAMYEWKYTTSYWGITTPIWYNQTSNFSNSRMDIYQSSRVNTWWGRAEHYIWGGIEVNIYAGNFRDWNYGKIWLDANISSRTWTQRKATVAHEMGHVFGLAHTGLAGNLMVNGGSDVSGVYRAQPNDLAGINYLY